MCRSVPRSERVTPTQGDTKQKRRKCYDTCTVSPCVCGAADDTWPQQKELHYYQRWHYRSHVCLSCVLMYMSPCLGHFLSSESNTPYNCVSFTSVQIFHQVKFCRSTCSSESYNPKTHMCLVLVEIMCMERNPFICVESPAPATAFKHRSNANL